jgi:hypothetical protein
VDRWSAPLDAAVRGEKPVAHADAITRPSAQGLAGPAQGPNVSEVCTLGAGRFHHTLPGALGFRHATPGFLAANGRVERERETLIAKVALDTHQPIEIC